MKGERCMVGNMGGKREMEAGGWWLVGGGWLEVVGWRWLVGGESRRRGVKENRKEQGSKEKKEAR